MQQAALGQLSTLIKAGARKDWSFQQRELEKHIWEHLRLKNISRAVFIYRSSRTNCQKSLASFRRVIGGKKTDYGLLTGNRHD